MIYSIDTSGLLDGWRRYYPIDVFPGIWAKLDGLIESGNLIATEEVYYELERQDDKVFEWARERRSMFLPIDEDIQLFVADILRKYDRLVNTQKGRSAADPFVIALAQQHGCTVVTGESRSYKLHRPKIPDVCDALGLKCIRMLDLFREQGWQIG